MPDDEISPTKSEALRASAAKLIAHSRQLREASDKVAKEAEEVAKLAKRVPKKDDSTDGPAKS